MTLLPEALLAVHSLLALQQADCPAYQCAETASVLMNSTTCVYADGGELFTKACTGHHGTFCPPLQWPSIVNSTCQPPPAPVIPLSWPGEKCLNDSYCAAGICQNGVCHGASVGESCPNNTYCNPGLYCDREQEVCRQAIPVGAGSHYLCNSTLDICPDPCDYDEDCPNNAGCNFGQCYPYFSLPPTEFLENCDSSNINLLCSGMFCLQGSSQMIACTEMPVSQNPSTDENPTSCSDNTDCPSVPDNSYPFGGPAVFWGNCLCSYNSTGSSSCGVFPGDPAGKLYVTALKAWVNSTAILQCNTHRRFDKNCMQSHWESPWMEIFTYAELQYMYYPSMVGMDACTQSVYLQDYFSALENLPSPPEKSWAKWGLAGYAIVVWVVG